MSNCWKSHAVAHIVSDNSISSTSAPGSLVSLDPSLMSTSTDTKLFTEYTSTLIQSTSVSTSTGTTSKSTMISNSNESENSNTYIENDDETNFDDTDNSILVDVVNNDIETTVTLDSEEETSYTAAAINTKSTTSNTNHDEDSTTTSYGNLNGQHVTSINNPISPTLSSGQPLNNINTSPSTPSSTSEFTSFTTSGELSEACSGMKSVVLLAKSGYITSPGFENNQPYPPNISCNWEIVEQENEVSIFNINAVKCQGSKH